MLADVIERAAEVENARNTIRITVEDLLTGAVIEGDESHGNDWSEYPPNREQEWHELRRDAVTVLDPANASDRGRSPELPAHDIAATERFANLLGVEVRLYHPGPDGNPRYPRLSVEFSPALAPMQQQVTCTL